MSKLTMNNVKIKAQGEELKDIAKDYVRIIDDIYDKLARISDNGIWVGGSASKYIGYVKRDKESVRVLGSNINDLGNSIINYSNAIKNISDIGVNK